MINNFLDNLEEIIDINNFEIVDMNNHDDNKDICINKCISRKKIFIGVTLVISIIAISSFLLSELKNMPFFISYINR